MATIHSSKPLISQSLNSAAHFLKPSCPNLCWCCRDSLLTLHHHEKLSKTQSGLGSFARSWSEFGMVSSKELSGVSISSLQILAPEVRLQIESVIMRQLICLLSARPLPSLAWAHSVVFNKTNGESIGHNDNDIASRQPTRTRHHPHSFSKLSLCLRTRFIYCLGLFWCFIRGRKFYLKCASPSTATFGRNQNPADTVLPYTANEYLRRTIMYICK